MKLTIFTEHTKEIEDFYERIRIKGFFRSIKGVRLDEYGIKSNPGYAIRLKGSFVDCLVMLRILRRVFNTRLTIGWPRIED